MNHKSTKTSSTSLLFWIFLFGITLLGVGLLWYTTPHGMALVNDSINYIDGARNIISGHGYSRVLGDGAYAPVTNFPPIYSIILAGFLLAGVDGISATWWLSLVFYGINLILVGWLGYKITTSRIFGILTALLFVASAPFLNFHTFALTEPIFLFTFFLSLIFLLQFLARKKWYWIVLSGVFASLAYLTRYIGASLFVTAIAALLIFLPGIKNKFRSSLLFVAGAVPAVAIWTVRNILLTGNATNRQSMWHIIPAESIQEGALSFWMWLLPERYNLIERFLGFWQVLLYFLLAGFLFVLVFVAVKYWLNRNKPTFQCQAVWIVAMQAAVYLLLLIFTLAYLDASVNFETRILMPIYNMMLLLFVAGVHWLWIHKSIFLKISAVFITIALLLSFAEDTLDVVRVNRSQGQGFANEYWTETQIWRELQKYPDRIIYTNRIRAVNLFLDRGAFILPSPINPSTGLPWENYDKNVATIRRKVFDGTAVMLVFEYQNMISIPEDKAWMGDLTTGLPVLAEYPEGIIFGLE